MQRRVINQMLRLSASGDKAKILRAFRLAEVITPESHKSSVRMIREKVQEDHPALLLSRHVATRLSPTCRDRFVEAFIVNSLLRGSAKRRAATVRSGDCAPTTVLFSPTMRCNLTCEGCYAAEYSPDKDMDRGLLQKIVNEGNDMGVYMFTVLGGEPFLYPELLDFARANRDSYFLVFSNGTLLTEDKIAELAAVGNIAPMLSVEGSRELTDERRGPGVYERVMRAMDDLGKAGVPFGFSATVTRRNWDTLVSDEFVDPLVAKGAMVGWHFLYMPVGREPNIELMPTPEEREEFRKGISRLRHSKAYFPIDFWGDAPWVGGCIAGRHYLHINSDGWVEPCIFTHFATDNIRDTSLLEAFNSPFFQELRRRQPFNHNLLMPCMWLDNPGCSREIISSCGARPTHDGADVMLTDLQKELDAYSAEAARVFNPVWSCMRSEFAVRPSDTTEAELAEVVSEGLDSEVADDAAARELIETGPRGV
jgi:MoaA/NifB/PqqE/SkfB family radical SAM enzyme